ncbi:hypothetical protein O7632_27680 [Solwaraspora sp. WMMD406]|uniref:hypothetical protein n=1 Tax=Solwaraspora sp. WMMD406 TaxID=3016095 RepID=UPI002416C850|nr:hypothetical protein [Solwaraspora sp. WMMD406]MDG4767846.1 hypothetical protein [Solwaraspora sp. WMMD406]
MSPFFAVFLVLLLASSSYAAGRLHGQLSYRIGYRFGYRQGYFDGDRGAWSRRRRDAQAAIASVLPTPNPMGPTSARPTPVGSSPVGPAMVGQTPVGSAMVGQTPVGSAAVTRSARTDVAVRQGTTYTGAAFTDSGGGRHSKEILAGWHT